MSQFSSPSRKFSRIPMKSGKSEENLDENEAKEVGSANSVVKSKQASTPASTVGSIASDETRSPDQRLGLIRRVLLHSSRGEWASLESVIKLLDNLGVSHPLAGVADEATGFTPLMYAVRDNRLPYLEKFLDLGCDVNAKTNDGCPVIHIAVAQSREDVVRLLLSRKPDFNALWKGQTVLHTVASRQGGPSANIAKLVIHQSKDFKLRVNNEGYLPLHLAVESGNYHVVKELLLTNPEFQITKECGPRDETPLHVAARRKDAEIAKILLDFGAIVDARNKDGQTALHIAASEGDETLVRILHSHHANPNLPDKEERTPLHLAAEKGRTSVVEVLADKYKASLLERTKDGSTLLHVASLHGHPETALMLLKKGVPLHMPNKSGARSIHIAARLGHVAVVQTLILRGEQVDTATNDNYTALHIAVENGKAQVVETLLGFGAQVHIKAGKEEETPLHVAARAQDGGDKCASMLLKSGADPNIKNALGLTPLHVAAKHGRLETVKLLLEDGADPTMQDSLGETPLHHAAENSHLLIVTQLCTHATIYGYTTLVNMQSSSGETALHSAAKSAKTDINLVMILLKNEANAALFTHSANETVLHYCAKGGHSKMMEAILVEGSNSQQVVNIQDANGRSPLLIAAKFGHTRAMELLLKNQGRVDVFDSEGFSALHLAAESGHTLACDLLLAHKAFVNSKSRQGLTPLHLAALKGYTNLVKRLVTIHGASIDSLTLRKETPLQLAAEAGQLEVCRLLLELGSDPEATDDSGQRALHRAAQRNHSSVLALFLQYQPSLAASANKDGNTCAHIAAMRGSVAVLQELMQADKGAVTSARNRTTEATPLHLAAEGGHAEVVKVLLDCGASPLDENKVGFTAVHIAARHGHTQVLEILRKSNASSLKSHSRKNGLTALHVAACYGQPETVRDLLSQVPAGTRSEPPNPLVLTSVPVLKELDGESGLTPLHLAAYSGDENVVRLLLNSPGVSVDSPSNQHGYTPLHLACRGGHSAIAGLLLARSTNLLTLQDKEGRAPLHAAASSGHARLTELLLGQGSEINGGDKEGWTPLHLAAHAGHEETVKLLLDSGASPRSRTFRGRIPLWYAVSEAHASVVSILLKKEHDPYLLLDDRKFVYNLMLCGKGYRALEEFILESPAPVDLAAKLSCILASIATKEKERSKELLQASKKCEMMASELLAIASSCEGASRLLTATDRQHVQLLDVLVENEQKEVIAHSAVQKYLQELWMGGLQWSSWKMMLLFLSCVFVPLIWLILSLPLGHGYDKIPVIRFMCYLTSHVYLMALLILASTLPICPVIRETIIPCWYEWILLAWLSGNLLAELSTPRDRAGLGWFRVAVLVVSAAAVLVHGATFFVASSYWPVMMFARNQLLAIAFLFCCILILDFLSFHYLFGPWAIIIGNLMVDAGRFLIILAIFMLGFSIHVAALNQPFEYRDLSLIQNTITEPLPSGVAVTPLDTFELLFFAIFGLTSAQSLRIEIAQPQWTMYLYKVVFGTYMLVTTVVLINMLIAMMSDTYQRIQAQSDTEWKYGLAKLVRSMHRTSATPSPLNLVTSWVNYLVDLRRKNRTDIVYALTTNGVAKENKDAPFLKRMFGSPSQVNPVGSTLLTASALGSQASMLPDRRTIEGVTEWRTVVKKYVALTSSESEK